MSSNDVAGKSSTELIEVPLGTEAHRYAKNFAAEQSSTQKGKQVYLNTLAVYAVHRYLDWLSIETDLMQSDSWNPVIRQQKDISDLFLPKLGRLECCSVLLNQTDLILPSEAIQEDRIGYIAVQFDEQLDRVKLLGFVGTLNSANQPKKLPLSELQSLEYLPSYFERRKLEFPSEIVDVGLWFSGPFEQVSLTPNWVSLSTPVSESLTRRTSGEELDTIAFNILKTKGIEIPHTAKAAYRDIQALKSLLRLYVITWPFSYAEVEKWKLLLILRATPGTRSLEPIKIQVCDQVKILSERILESGSHRPYQVIQVVGNLYEEFLINISSPDGSGRQSYLFQFSMK